jgi:hypothetical protein
MQGVTYRDGRLIPTKWDLIQAALYGVTYPNEPAQPDHVREPWDVVLTHAPRSPHEWWTPGREFYGPLSEAPHGSYFVIGPDPYRRRHRWERRYFAKIMVTRSFHDGRLLLIRVV